MRSLFLPFSCSLGRRWGAGGWGGVLVSAWLLWEGETLAALGTHLGCSFWARPLLLTWLGRPGTRLKRANPHCGASHRCAAATGCHGAPGKSASKFSRELGWGIPRAGAGDAPRLADPLGGLGSGIRWGSGAGGCSQEQTRPPGEMLSVAVGSAGWAPGPGVARVLLPPASPCAHGAAGHGFPRPLQPLKVGFFSNYSL